MIARSATPAKAQTTGRDHGGRLDNDGPVGLSRRAPRGGGGSWEDTTPCYAAPPGYPERVDEGDPVILPAARLVCPNVSMSAGTDGERALDDRWGRFAAGRTWPWFPKPFQRRRLGDVAKGLGQEDRGSGPLEPEKATLNCRNADVPAQTGVMQALRRTGDVPALRRRL